ncbi:hypothetical protein EZ449_14125 [Pedobacter frigidisoli]|uniref:Signal transduction histidine kinase internal region domain-containing protein n=1 Tax=Pedobacter frigidisoli TaxID=2530455 RepID=A0A4R0P2M0_9SPHI|nr:histidine kinase [Pedobacter frigidisoli]TCD07668.1 hypothetical protein EZ449_14125 [Pedobacter frigidisoli]
MTKKIQNWAIANKIHLIGWSLYIFCEVLLIGFASGRFGKPEAYLFHYSLNIILFYLNTFIVLKSGYDRSRLHVAILSSYLIMEIVLFISLKVLVDAVLIGPQAGQLFGFVDLPYFLQTLWRVLQFIGLSFFLFMFIRYKRERLEKEQSKEKEHEGSLRNKELEVALHEATNAYLKAQINPHFIFNILGFIHDSVLRTDARAAQAVIDLSELIRFAVNSDQNDQEPQMSLEITQVESLIRLYQLRFKERAFVQFTYQNGAGESRLIPLVLLTLVENLFKHGDIHIKDDPAKIDIAVDKQSLRISTYNRIMKGNQPQGFNKGMENIRTRLLLNYPDRCDMKYGQADVDHFFVWINIKAPTVS